MWIAEQGEEARNAFSRGYVGRECGFQHGLPSLLPLEVERRQQEVAFGWEEMVEAALMHAGVRAQVVHAHRAIAAGVDKLGRARNQSLSGILSRRIDRRPVVD